MTDYGKGREGGVGVYLAPRVISGRFTIKRQKLSDPAIASAHLARSASCMRRAAGKRHATKGGI